MTIQNKEILTSGQAPAPGVALEDSLFPRRKRTGYSLFPALRSEVKVKTLSLHSLRLEIIK